MSFPDRLERAIKARQMNANDVDSLQRMLQEARAERDRAIAQRDALYAVASGCHGYLLTLPIQYKPDSQWFKPLEQAISQVDGGR